MAAPCGADAVRSLLQPLVLVYGVGDAARTAAFWKVYREQLASFPFEALEQAVTDYAGLPDSQFFPKPGPLKALAAKRAEPILKALSRAKRAANAQPPKHIPPEDAEVRRREVAKLMAGFSIKPAAIRPGNRA